jgi:hypothetical protein
MTEGIPQKFTITKRYGRKVSQNFQSFDFISELTTEVTVVSAQELIDASNKLFLQCKFLTEQDIENTFPQEPVTGE